MKFPQAPPRAVVFDLGDVLFSWSASTTTTIPARKVREILSTSIWYSYDRGEITRDDCYKLSAQQFSLPEAEIAKAFTQARESLQPDGEIVAFLRELKSDPTIKVYAMSNIGKEDFDDLSTKLDWSLFDRVFTSAAAGSRKPELGFYRHVLDQIGLAGNQVVFTDDKKENIQAAQTLGIRGLVFEESTVRALRSMFNGHVVKGWKYLFQNANHCNSITNTGISFEDDFAKLLIIETLNDRTLVNLTWGSKKTWNFFSDKIDPISGYAFPDDLDTTCLALKALQPPSRELISSLLDSAAEYVNKDGTFLTYFDRRRPRVDPVVSANILACFYSFGRGREFDLTLQVVHSVLSERSYMEGTRYYTTSDCCLGFIARLLRSSDDTHLHTSLEPLLESRLMERLGESGSALDLAMRIMACTQLGIHCEEDRKTLLGLQGKDGSWEPGWMYRYGSTGMKIGNRAVTTAMAVAALGSA